jgi:hypothetical protein
MKSVIVFGSIILCLTLSHSVRGQTESTDQTKQPMFSSTRFSTSFHYEGNAYRYEVSDDDLVDTPSWNAEQNEPPLSPRDAAGIASTAFRRFVKTGEKWRVDGIAAHHVSAEKWIYDVSFSCSSARCVKETFTPRFSIILKMDGSVVEPVIKADEKQNE